jgi:hypothetical protein
MTSKAVRWKLDRGLWVRVHLGVYQTLPGRDDWYTSALAAQLAVVGSAWSHRTAGHIHGLVAEAPDLLELVVDERRRVAEPAGVKVHRCVNADAYVDQLHWPWRVLVDDTVLDLAESGTDQGALALLGRAFQKRLTTESALRSLLETRSRHARRDLLNDVLTDVSAGAESVMEIRFLRDVERAHGLPTGRRQATTLAKGLRLHDVAYDEWRLLPELDGELGHQGFGRIADGIRDRRNAGRGWLTVRAFWVDVAVMPCELADEMGAVFAARGWRGRPRACRRQTCVMPREDIGALWP